MPNATVRSLMQGTPDRVPNHVRMALPVKGSIISRIGPNCPGLSLRSGCRGCEEKSRNFWGDKSFTSSLFPALSLGPGDA